MSSDPIEQFDSQSNPVSPTKKPSILPTGFPTIGGTPLSVVPEVVPSTFPGSQQLWAEVGPTPSIPMSPLPEVPATPRKLRIIPSAPASPSLRRSKSKLSSGQTTPVIRRSVSLAEEMDDQPDFAPAAPARSPSRSSAEGNDEPPSLLRPELISDMVFHESIIKSLKKQKTASLSVLASPDAIPDKLRSVANLLSNLVESLWVKEGDEVWNHEPLLEEYWNLLESEVREDVHNGCNPDDIENDKSAISVITRLIGRLNYLWAGIVSNDEDHLEVMLPQSISQLAIARTVLKQQRRIDHLEGELDFQHTIKDFLGMHRQGAVQFQDAFSYLLKGIVTMNDNFTMLSNDMEREVNRTLHAVRSAPQHISAPTSTTRAPTTTGTGKRKLDSSSFVDAQGNVIAPTGSKRTKNNDGQAVEQAAPASSHTVPAHLTNEQIAKAVPLVVATKDAPTPLSYEQALALIEQFDIVPKGRRIDPTAPTTTVIPSQEDVPRGGLQTTLDGGLYSAKATKATTAKFNATANPKSAMSKAKERATHLQAPKESTKLLRVIYDGGEANDSAKGLTLQQVQGYVEDLLRRLGLQANPVLAIRWTQPYLLDVTFTQRPSDVLQDALSTRAVWFLNLPASESVDKYTWPIVDYYIPTALLTLKQVSILTNVGTIVSTAEVYQELVGRNDFLNENILAYEQSPKLTIGKPTGDKADISFAVLDSPKGIVEGWLKSKKKVVLAGNEYLLTPSLEYNQVMHCKRCQHWGHLAAACNTFILDGKQKIERPHICARCSRIHETSHHNTYCPHPECHAWRIANKAATVPTCPEHHDWCFLCDEFHAPNGPNCIFFRKRRFVQWHKNATPATSLNQLLAKTREYDPHKALAAHLKNVARSTKAKAKDNNPEPTPSGPAANDMETDDQGYIVSDMLDALEASRKEIKGKHVVRTAEGQASPGPSSWGSKFKAIATKQRILDQGGYQA